MAALLKSVESKDFVGSNPTLSASTSGIEAAGLCAACRHSRLITTTRGSEFRLCERSATEPAYPRYPALPVVRCQGFETVERSSGTVPMESTADKSTVDA